MVTKAHSRRVSKIKSSIHRLRTKVRNKYHRLREDERAWKSFQKGYRIGLLYFLVIRPAQAIDTLDELLERALQNVTDTTPAKAVGKLTAVKNWLQKLNLSDFSQCFTTFGLAKLAGCSPYYVMGFISALLTYKVYKHWKPK